MILFQMCDHRQFTRHGHINRCHGCGIEWSADSVFEAPPKPSEPQIRIMKEGHIPPKSDDFGSTAANPSVPWRALWQIGRFLCGVWFWSTTIAAYLLAIAWLIEHGNWTWFK